MYIGFSQPGAYRPRDHRLPDPRRRSPCSPPCPAWPRPRSWAGRPSPCASGSTRTGWRRAGSRPPMCAAAIARQQLPVRSRSGQGLLHGGQHHRRHRPHQPRRLPRHGGEGRAAAALVRLSDVATIELGAQSSDSSVRSNGRRAVVHRRLATPTAIRWTIVKARAQAVPDIAARRCRPACRCTIVYDFDPLHQRLDQRGQPHAGRGGR